MTKIEKAMEIIHGSGSAIASNPTKDVVMRQHCPSDYNMEDCLDEDGNVCGNRVYCNRCVTGWNEEVSADERSLQDVIYRLRIDLRDARDDNRKLEQQLYQKDDMIGVLKRKKQVKDFERERNRSL